MLSTNSRAARPSSGRSARNPTTHGLVPRALLAGSLAFALIACAPATVTTGGSGGKSGSGGSSSGGSGSGGSGSGGSNNGGSAQGGSANSGGSAKGGSNSGGSASGGNANGGSNSGGSNSGGSNSGGSSSGGSNSGGSAKGGSNSGGSNSGGSAQGGSSPNGGSAAGGSGAGGSSGTGTRPPGYYYTKDWNVTSVDWHGCVWTGVDIVAGSDTSILPQDFMGVKDGGPYHVTGTVFNNYNSVALLGFNLNEATNGSSTQCQYNKAAATAVGPPGVAPPSGTTGIAFNWTQGSSTLIRVQIQGPNGATDPTDRWCYNVTDPGGNSFAPYASFNTKCWTDPATPPGTAYNTSKPISAVVFLIAGDVTKKPFDFTVNGIAPGNSAADAPKVGTVVCGKQTGTLGSSTASKDASMARAKVTGTDCKQYVVQSNNWGTPLSTTQIINFTGTGFTIASTSGNVTGQGVPAAFPSTFIGGNGNIAGGTYSTWTDSGLPKQVSSISSVQTSFGWSGGSGGKDFNATYDVWFAASPPTAGAYEDGVSALLMVWLYKPGSRTPIGSVVRSGVTVSGVSGTWDVYVGKRNTTAVGATDLGRPVISYVAKSTLNSLTFDLKKFMDDAAANGTADQGKANPPTSIPFSSSLYLTDVFAGFEIWTGSDATGLTSTGFTAVVN